MDFRLTPDGNVTLEMYFCSPVPFYASFSSPFPPPSPLLLLLGGSGATVESSLHAGHAPHRYKSVSLTHTPAFFSFFFFYLVLRLQTSILSFIFFPIILVTADAQVGRNSSLDFLIFFK